MSAVWDGKRIEIPCVPVRSWLDTNDPRRPPRTPNCYTNKQGSPGKYLPSMVQPITGVVWHTVKGTATGEVTPRGDVHCLGENGAFANAEYFARKSTKANPIPSAHFIIGDNGVALQVADLVTDRCWHAGSSQADWNPFTIGIEIDQSSDKAICQGALDTAVNLAWWLTVAFGIQPMFPFKNGRPDLSDIERLQGNNARNFRGHYFHAGQAVRGAGDPGPAVGVSLKESGFEGFDLSTGEDLRVWQARQAILQMPLVEQDGIPGAHTVAAMRKTLARPTWVMRNNPPACAQEESNVVGVVLGLAAAGLLGAAAYRYIKKRRRRT